MAEHRQGRPGLHPWPWPEHAFSEQALNPEQPGPPTKRHPTNARTLAASGHVVRGGQQCPQVLLNDCVAGCVPHFGITDGIHELVWAGLPLPLPTIRPHAQQQLEATHVTKCEVG
eukprot:1237266-Alexandrium_andersonii.AAC.1